MSRNCYSEINLHVVWRVKDSLPVLKGDIERQLRRHLRDHIQSAKGFFCHEVGGADDHDHVAVTVPPTACISEWIGELKGASSHYVNNVIANRKVLEWQTGYGVVSFGTRDLPWVIEYVRSQREHHARGTVHERLERVEPEEESKPPEGG